MSSLPRKEEPAPVLRSEKLLQEHHRLSVQVEELEHELHLMKSSRSWKLTAPLRKGRLILNYLCSFLPQRAHRLFFSTAAGIIPREKGWRQMETAGHFVIASSHKRMPLGWTTFRLSELADDTPREFALYVDSGDGFSEGSRYRLYFDATNRCTLRLPNLVRALRVDPLNVHGDFSLVGFRAREHFGALIFLRRIFSQLRASGIAGAWALIRGWSRLFFSAGTLGLTDEVFAGTLAPIQRNRLYARWVAQFDTLSDAEREQLKLEARQFSLRPLLSVLMPVYNVPERYLRGAIESVLRQTYDHWELCIADDASTRPTVRAVLQEFAARDQRVRVCYRERNGHISESSNTALSMAQGEFVVLMDHDDVLAEDALSAVVRVHNRYPEVELLYSDEDRLSAEEKRVDPYFKGGWNPELFLAQNLISHLGVYKRERALAIGGFRVGFEGSQDWDFALRFAEHLPAEHIYHIPRVLYHWRWVPGTVSFTVETKVAAFTAAENSVREHLARSGKRASAEWDPRIQAVRVRYVPDSGGITCSVLRFDSSVSELKKHAAAAPDPYLLFLDDASRAAEVAWTEELIPRIKGSGAVIVGGAVWSSSGRLKNAGYVLSADGSAVPVHVGLSRGERGYFGRAMLPQAVFAVGLNGMAMRRDTFLQLLPSCGSNDPDTFAIELCLAAWRAGLSVQWTPFAEFETDVQRFSATAIRCPGEIPQSLFEAQVLNPNISKRNGNFSLAFPPEGR